MLVHCKYNSGIHCHRLKDAYIAAYKLSACKSLCNLFIPIITFQLMDQHQNHSLLYTCGIWTVVRPRLHHSIPLQMSLGVFWGCICNETLPCIDRTQSNNNKNSVLILTIIVFDKLYMSNPLRRQILIAFSGYV